MMIKTIGKIKVVEYKAKFVVLSPKIKFKPITAPIIKRV